jgi:hypothetical protein
MDEPESTDPAEQERERIWARLDGSPGTRLESELGALALSARTFDVNTQILLQEVRSFENAFPNELVRPGRRRELWEFSFDVVRLFQNAIASGESFLEHCRSTVKRRYRNDSFYDEFAATYANVIEDSPACMFVKQLRGFLLHKESVSPALSSKMADFSDPYDSPTAIRLSTSGIETERDRWGRENPKALKYLDRLQGFINIRRLMDEYRQSVKQLGDWLMQREREINTAALSEVDALYRELRRLMGADYPEDLDVFREGSTGNSWFA